MNTLFTPYYNFINKALDKNIIDANDNKMLEAFANNDIDESDLIKAMYGNFQPQQLYPRVSIYKLIIMVHNAKKMEGHGIAVFSRYIDHMIPKEYNMNEMEGYIPGIIEYEDKHLEYLESVIGLSLAHKTIAFDEATLLRNILNDRVCGKIEMNDWDMNNASHMANDIYMALIAPIFGDREFVSIVEKIQESNLKNIIMAVKEIQGTNLTIDLAKSIVKNMGSKILSNYFKTKVIELEGGDFLSGLVHRHATIAEEVLLLDSYNYNEKILLVNDYVRRLLIGYALCIELIDNDIKQGDIHAVMDYIKESNIDPYDMVRMEISKINVGTYECSVDRINDCVKKFT